MSDEDRSKIESPKAEEAIADVPETASSGADLDASIKRTNPVIDAPKATGKHSERAGGALSETDEHGIEERVIEIVSDQLGVSQDNLKRETSFTELGADSLDTVELVMEFEEEFDIQIPDQDAEQIATIDDAIKYIQSQKDKDKKK